MTNQLFSPNRRHLLAGAGAALITRPALAQAYPARTITLVVPFPAGGTTDVTARLVAQEISGPLGQSIIVENRAGANGNIGSAYVAKAAPDGYTLLATGVGSNAVNHGIYKTMPYDSSKDFAHITMMTSGPNVLVVNKDFPARDMKELIALLKANPGKYNYASSGTGASGHMAMELLKLKAGVNIQYVPYRGGAPAVNDVVGGQVPMMFINQDTALPHVRSGKLRPLAVTSAQRNPLYPDVPTIAESGFPGFQALSWSGLSILKGTPQPIVDKLEAALKKVMTSPE
eukprot:gene62063-biopygen42123